MHDWQARHKIVSMSTKHFVCRITRHCYFLSQRVQNSNCAQKRLIHQLKTTNYAGNCANSGTLRFIVYNSDLKTPKNVETSTVCRFHLPWSVLPWYLKSSSRCPPDAVPYPWSPQHAAVTRTCAYKASSWSRTTRRAANRLIRKHFRSESDAVLRPKLHWFSPHDCLLMLIAHGIRKGRIRTSLSLALSLSLSLSLSFEKKNRQLPEWTIQPRVKREDVFQISALRTELSKRRKEEMLI